MSVGIQDQLNVLEGVSPGAPQDFHTISKYVRAHFFERQDQPIKVLEAGCGQKPFLEPTTMDYRITGIDLSAEAIRLTKPAGRRPRAFNRWRPHHRAATIERVRYCM